MFRNLFAAAIVAALCAGLVFSVVQHLRLTPLIYAAESYEAAHGAEPHVHEGDDAQHTHASDEWQPQDGVERLAYTVLANVLAAAGYALILGAVALAAGLPVTSRNGALWGIGGFAAFMLAPSLGLPPGLPGMAVADTLARQIWWWGTALATGAGLLAYAKWRSPWALAVAAILIAIPHLVGAPQPPDAIGLVPANLASSFTAAALFANAVLWVTLGLVFGWVADWLRARSLPATGAPA